MGSDLSQEGLMHVLGLLSWYWSHKNVVPGLNVANASGHISTFRFGRDIVLLQRQHYSPGYTGLNPLLNCGILSMFNIVSISRCSDWL